MSFAGRVGRSYNDLMKTVRLADAESHLSALIDAVIGGEDVVITRDEAPVARLSAFPTLSITARPSLRDHKPISVGGFNKRSSADDDLLAEMLDDRG